MTALQPAGGEQSPFDSIRQTGPDGQEFWSARDLMPLLEYAQWRQFNDAIQRAMAAAENSGSTAADHFADARKIVTLGAGATREVADYHLTRYGAYLTAMNSDPRKPAVASAMTYFAVRTREAEIRPAGLDMTALAKADPNAALAIGQALAGLAQANLALEARVIEAAPKVAAYDELVASDGLLDMTSLANTLGMNTRDMTNWLVEEGVFRRQVSQGNGRNLPRKGYQPEHFVVKTETNGYATYPVVYATGAGLDLVVRLRRDGAA